MDSSRVLLFAGSPSSPPLARSAISFLAATLLGLDVSPIHGCQVLRWGLAGTKEAKDI